MFFCSLFTIHKQIEWSRSIAEYWSVFSGQSNGSSIYWLKRIKLNQDNGRNNSIWKKFWSFFRAQQSDESLWAWEQRNIHEEALKIRFLEIFCEGAFFPNLRSKISRIFDNLHGSDKKFMKKHEIYQKKLQKLQNPWKWIRNRVSCKKQVDKKKSFG